jgi:UDP-glucuronate 4-epimerase
VVKINVVNDYYDPALKKACLEGADEAAARSRGSYQFIRADLADRRTLDTCFANHKFDWIIHLAAQAGVRYSLENPRAYVESNVIAFTHLLLSCREADAPQLVYASTSSVYGANTRGAHMRDFTHMDDTVDGVLRASDDIARSNPQWNSDDPDPATSS